MEKKMEFEINGEKFFIDFEEYLKMREYEEKREQEAFLHWYGPDMGPILWAALRG